MTYRWEDMREVDLEKPAFWAWPIILVRAVLIAVTIFGLMIPLIVLRKMGFEHAGQGIVKTACKICLFVIGLRVVASGTPMKNRGGVVANHSSWLDIFTLNAVQRVYFVSKSDVADWPLIGSISRSTGTVFIRRKATDAAEQKASFLERLQRGHHLLFFPEGTSTDGRRVLPFKSSLFQAYKELDSAENLFIQPITVYYRAPKSRREDFYGWWGDMGFFEHFALVLGQIRQGCVQITFHVPISVADCADRKELAKRSEEMVREGFQSADRQSK